MKTTMFLLLFVGSLSAMVTIGDDITCVQAGDSLHFRWSTFTEIGNCGFTIKNDQFKQLSPLIMSTATEPDGAEYSAVIPVTEYGTIFYSLYDFANSGRELKKSETFCVVVPPDTQVAIRINSFYKKGNQVCVNYSDMINTAILIIIGDGIEIARFIPDNSGVFTAKTDAKKIELYEITLDGKTILLERYIDEFKIYPNPFNDTFSIEGFSGDYQIYNVLGECMFRGSSPGMQKIDFPSGRYILTAGSLKKTITKVK